MILYNIFLIILLPLALFFFYIKNKNFFFDQAQKLSHKQFTSSKKHTPLLGGWIVLYGVFFFFRL